MIERIYTTVEEARFYRDCAQLYGLKDFSVSILGCSVFSGSQSFEASNTCTNDKVKTEEGPDKG